MAQAPLEVEVEEDYRYAYEGACEELGTLYRVCTETATGHRSVAELAAFIEQFKNDALYLSDAMK